jgi:hypothetical protein
MFYTLIGVLFPVVCLGANEQGIRHTEEKGTKRHEYLKNHSNSLNKQF